MTLSEIAKYRFFQQQLDGTDFRDAVQMVSWFGAIQGQEYAQSRWSLGLRMPDLKDRDIEKDFNEGRILRTHLLRPTWHLVTAEDIRWLLALTAPRVNAANAFSYRRYELGDALFNRCNDIILKALEGGGQLTRNEINHRFREAGIIAESSRLSYIFMKAELEGLICSGPRKGKQFTYALLEERVGKQRKLDAEEALGELSTRYFQSRGPATLHDFSTWSGLTLAQCRQGAQMLEPRLLHERAGEGVYYFFPEGISDREPGERMHLLPIYDEYMMGYKNREAIFERKNATRPSQAILLGSTVAYKGQIIGTWKRIEKGKSTSLEFDFFEDLAAPQHRLLKSAMERMKAFTGRGIIL